MIPRCPPSLHRFLPALPILLCGIAFALFTHHAWEDWYITYRASKNLALGHGLVFNPGEIVHTFTSPINVLLPALLSFLLGNRSDDAVLWLYRLASLGCLTLAAGLLYQTLRRLGVSVLWSGFALAMIAVDTKIIDFSINGQEVAFVLLFLSLSLHSITGERTGCWRWLGIAWAGSMWTRPDGFIYVACSVLPFLLFAPGLTPWRTRRALVPVLAKAALLALLLYAPWLAWSTWYYGTPLPHSMIAKGLFFHPSAQDLFIKAIWFPSRSLGEYEALAGVFAPIYYGSGGWSPLLLDGCRYLAWLAAWLWVLPGLRPAARCLSFATMTGGFYLSHGMPFPLPWYYPPVTLLAITTLAIAFNQFFSACLTHIRHKRLVLALQGLVFSTCVALSAILFVQSAWQLKTHQLLVEDSLRKPLGLWLKEHARPGDTVFLECVGYIGFFSQLETYDWPGMTSPTMVKTRRETGNISDREWNRLITALKPDWLVLRPEEIDRINHFDPGLLTTEYQIRQTWSSAALIHTMDNLPGRPYLEFDQTFIVFRRK